MERVSKMERKPTFVRLKYVDPLGRHTYDTSQSKRLRKERGEMLKRSVSSGLVTDAITDQLRSLDTAGRNEVARVTNIRYAVYSDRFDAATTAGALDAAGIGVKQLARLSRYCRGLGKTLPFRTATDVRTYRVHSHYAKVVPVKLFMIFYEAHDFIKKWNTIGMFNEDAFEARHATRNGYKRRFASTRNTSKRDQLVLEAFESRLATRRIREIAIEKTKRPRRAR